MAITPIGKGIGTMVSPVSPQEARAYEGTTVCVSTLGGTTTGITLPAWDIVRYDYRCRQYSVQSVATGQVSNLKIADLLSYIDEGSVRIVNRDLTRRTR